VFSIYADVQRPGAEELCISEACVDCIGSLKLDEISAWDTEGRVCGYIKAAFPRIGKAELRRRETAICNELRRTPHLPHFAQRDDLPFSCGDVTEYTGRPHKRREWQALTRTAIGWRQGKTLERDVGEEDETEEAWPEGHPWLDTFIPADSGNELPSLGGFSAFRCLKCGKRYWTVQCT
jgi:hypothetical protein